jgi:Fungal protein kinase
MMPSKDVYPCCSVARMCRLMVKGTAENYWKDLHGWPFSQHVHCCYATSPIGESLASFKCKKEFITVMTSLIQSKLFSLPCASNEACSNSIAHQYLVEKLGILHCDISINNLLINCTNAIICGLLIDFDFAILLSAANAPAVQTSTSTSGNVAVGTMYEASGTNSNVGDVKRIVVVIPTDPRGIMFVPIIFRWSRSL